MGKWIISKIRIHKITLLIVSTLMNGCANPWVANGFEMPIEKNQESIQDLVQEEPDSTLADNQLIYEQELALLTSQINELSVERDALISANEELRSQNTFQKSYSAKLKLAFLAKHSEVNQLILDQQNTIQEMVRIQAKLLSRNSRAETVSTMAEATMLVNKAKEVAQGDQTILVDRADQLLEMSSVELDEENYDGATFLANQSAVLVQAIINLNNQKTAKEGSVQFEAQFAIPLEMNSLSNINVRQGPDMQSAVVFSLEKDKIVTADGYFKEWIHISVSDQQGWVYYKLIELAL